MEKSVARKTHVQTVQTVKFFRIDAGCPWMRSEGRCVFLIVLRLPCCFSCQEFQKYMKDRGVDVSKDTKGTIKKRQPQSSEIPSRLVVFVTAMELVTS